MEEMTPIPVREDLIIQTSLAPGGQTQADGQGGAGVAAVSAVSVIPVAMPVPVVAAEPVAAAPYVAPLKRGVRLRFLQIEGDPSTPETFEAVIDLDGLKCNVDLMSEDDVAGFYAEEERYKGMMPLDALASRRAYFSKTVIAKLKGFDGFKLQDGQRLRNVAIQARFCTLLLQKSQSGFSETDFGTAVDFSAGS